MSGTSASFRGSEGGILLPVPQLRVFTQGDGNGNHDRLYVGHMLKAEFEPLKDLSPTLFLYRYKRGTSANQARPYPFDRIRGFVHPSTWRKQTGVNTTNYGGGSHTTRGGLVAVDRVTEWPVTKALDYYATWEPENWFTSNNGNALTYPVNETFVGYSGQSSSTLWVDNNLCPNGKPQGTQRQVFAFGYAVKDKTDPRNWIRGPISERVVAEIFPRQKLSYCLPPLKDIGRKVRLSVERL